MSDPSDGIEAPCRPAGWQSERVTGARALPIPLATSHGFASTGSAGQRFGVRRATGRPLNGRGARALVIRLASSMRRPSGDGPRAGLRPSIDNGMFDERVRRPGSASKVTG